MPYGWTGVNVEVDLSRGKVEKVKSDAKLVEDYLGGKGTNAKTLWDRVPPEVDAFSPDNPVIISTGLLTGTPVPGANRTNITYKSPVTDIYSWSAVGGFFAPELKHAGYDQIVITGKSPTPVYLWINNDQIEIRDASHLWGKDTRETVTLIREELKNDKVQVLCIGLAGENQIYGASIEHSTGASASRGGGGTVMGDKKLKAVAVYGTKDVSIANPARLIELSEQIHGRIERDRTGFFEPWGKVMVAGFTRLGAFGNWGEPIPYEQRKEIAEKAGAMAEEYMRKSRTREVACYNCGLRCKHAYPHSDGGYSFIKCGSWGMPMIATKIFDIAFLLKFYNLCEKYGMDSFTASSCIFFATDLYQKGILTKEDTGGMHLEWGNPEVAFSLLDKLVHREGLGEVLAQGVYRAAKQIGKGAEDHAITIKKQDPILWEVRGTRSALTLAISDKQDTTRFVSQMATAIWPRSREDREKYLKTGFFPYPKDFEEGFLADFDPNERNYEVLVKFLAYDEDTYTLCDLTGICYFWVWFYPYPPITHRSQLAELIACVTGMDIDEARATKIAKRVSTLIRAYNVREGMRRKDDTVPQRLFGRPPLPPFGKTDPDLLVKFIDEWYKTWGWDSEGIPTKETLEELKLDYVRQDLERRGILKG